MAELIVAKEHSSLLDLWQERDERSLSVCHVDFHCDMRGLLIDRPRGRARFVWQCDPYMRRIDSGSFLAHAIMQGIVAELNWVHDDFGGRNYDDLYCVKYEKDLSAKPFMLKKKSWVYFSYKETTFNEWKGPQEGEFLSIDWDGLAFAEYEDQHINRLISNFLAHELKSECVFVSHSPEYSNPDISLFDNFIKLLEKKLNTKAVFLPEKSHGSIRANFWWNFYHGIEFMLLKFMRKFNFY